MAYLCFDGNASTERDELDGRFEAWSQLSKEVGTDPNLWPSRSEASSRQG